MLANASHIHCDNCGKVQPLLMDFMPENDMNDHAATDLMCMVCASIIATIHHISPTDEDITNARRAVSVPDVT